MISKTKINRIPDSPGVYFFKDAKGRILYIGKATSLRSRVRSYFSKGLPEMRGPLVVKMMAVAKRVDFMKTDSVLEALILEAGLIKKYKPFYNTAEKDDKTHNFVVITEENFPRITVVRGRLVEQNYSNPALYRALYGPFPNGSAIKEALKIIRRIFPFRDNKCVPLQNSLSNGSVKPCFNRQIGLCPGVCTGEISKREYNKTVKNIIMFFNGQKRRLCTTLEKEMRDHANKQKFEQASRVKKTLFALKHIRDVALLGQENNLFKIDKGERIEAYDIAHMAGESAVGVMTVVTDGRLEKNEYRMFKIKQSHRGNDIQALTEVINRRFTHNEWRIPSIVVVDGGMTHIKYAKQAVSNLGLDIDVVSVVKDDKHRPKDILGNLEIIKKHQKAILFANAEAHRFAIKHHRKFRERVFL